MSNRLLIAVIALLVLVYVFLRKRDKDKRLVSLNYWYAVLLFSFYPLVFSPIQGYQAMGTFKARIWAVMTLSLVFYELVFLIASRLNLSFLSDIKSSPIDIAMLVYVFTATISFFMAGDKKVALVGLDGWYTGLLFQYGIVAVYFSISRFGKLDKRLVYVILISAMVVFLIGIMHRFQVDPIGIYRKLMEEDYIRFLSTIGQATWYSAYLCLVFPIGLHLFLFRGPGRDGYLSGVFLAISAATLVTQNSDTAYGAIFVIMICYLVFVVTKSLDDQRAIVRLGLAILIMSASVLIVGMLERAFSDMFVRLDDLSISMAQGIIPVMGIMVGAAVISLGKARPIVKRAVATAFVVIFVLAGIGIVTFTSFDVYFISGRDWGNGRGLIWMRTLQMFGDQPLISKLFGIGPGMFYEKISAYTELILANAHNEWLTSIVEFGIIGGLSYLSIFVMAIAVAIRRLCCLQSEEVSENSQEIAYLEYIVIASTIAYLVHGFFNYQQCISTPMFFVLLGLYSAVSRTKDHNL